MKLFIRNMVCNRCKMAVKDILEKQDLHPEDIELGEVTIKEELSDKEKEVLNSRLAEVGFELIDDKKSRLIEKIKNAIIRLAQQQEGPLKMKLSDHLTDELHLEYSSISKLFSEVEGTTIEKYYIEQKIEKVKELLVYDELSLSEIAFNLGYSNVSHLSGQFKKITGFTPTHYKELKDKKRRPLDAL